MTAQLARRRGLLLAAAGSAALGALLARTGLARRTAPSSGGVGLAAPPRSRGRRLPPFEETVVQRPPIVHPAPTGKPDTGYRAGPFWRRYDRAAEALDRRYGWDRLPRPVGLAVLVGLRNQLRRHNLYDTGGLPRPEPRPPVDHRSPDGTGNDPDQPAMGSAGTRFGRNVPIGATHRESRAGLLSPSPREVSRALMTRDTFVPARSVNVLAAAWIQFMVRDWFSHGQGDPRRAWTIPLADDDPWPDRPMRILETIPDQGRPGAPPTYRNTETHWWDGSQLYGSDADQQRRRRTGRDGKLVVGADGRLVLPDDPTQNPALVPGWWLGLNMMTTLFVHEHNAICDALRAEYPGWSDEQLFQRARLITAALTARIHTVEWTPAIIAHPTTVTAMHANWWGLAGERLHRLGGGEVLGGIPGSPTAHHGVPYALTEEFSIVYRMHPLIPDDYVIRAAADGRVLRRATFPELAGPAAQEITARIPMADLIHSFGTAHPGAIVLRNFPRHLQEFRRPDGRLMDLAAHDILRTRELGVPRYNEFRRLLRLRPAGSFTELTDDAGIAAELRRVYGDDVERVDLITGMFAERRPAGFAFSDTAFRIFILMASRRLNSDRFFTRDFTPRVYTPLGLDWIQRTTMTDVLRRHHPELGPALRGVDNAFQPWPGTPAD